MKVGFSAAVTPASVKPCIENVHNMIQCPIVHLLSQIFVKSGIKVCFSAAVIAGHVKPCIVIVLDILFKHTFDPHFVLH